MIEAWKMLKFRVRLYIDKLFQLMLNPQILGLRLKMLARQAKCRVGAKLLHRRGGELREKDGSYGEGGGLLRRALPPRSGPQAGAPLGLHASLFCNGDIWTLG